MRAFTRSTTCAKRGAAVLALAIGLAACGGGDAEAEVDTGATDTGATADALEVIAVDYGFEGIPDSVAAGTQMTLRNDAPEELHELVAFRLDDDEERSIDELVGLPPEELQQLLGEPTTVILTPPDSDRAITAVGDGTLQDPGRYALICMIPTGADPDEYLEAAATSDGPPDVPGGPPHIVHGMYAEVNVE